jgi:hypothetical protein
VDRRFRLALACAAVLCAAPAAAQDCALCFTGDRTEDGERPLTLEISTGIEFSRLALTGQGKGIAAIDPQTGSRQTGGTMIELGGLPVQGRGRITGTPLRPVRMTLPQQVTMTSSTGSDAVLTNFVTDLPAFPMLPASGVLEFAFGAQIEVTGLVGGTFRARIPITIDYN